MEGVVFFFSRMVRLRKDTPDGGKKKKFTKVKKNLNTYRV